jgi:hypothetical protein
MHADQFPKLFLSQPFFCSPGFADTIDASQAGFAGGCSFGQSRGKRAAMAVMPPANSAARTA